MQSLQTLTREAFLSLIENDLKSPLLLEGILFNEIAELADFTLERVMKFPASPAFAIGMAAMKLDMPSGPQPFYIQNPRFKSMIPETSHD